MTIFEVNTYHIFCILFKYLNISNWLNNCIFINNLYRVEVNEMFLISTIKLHFDNEYRLSSNISI